MIIKTSQRFLIIGSACVILLLGITSWVIQTGLQKNTQEEVANSLSAVLDTTYQAVKTWAGEHKAVVSMAANTPEVRQFVHILQETPANKEKPKVTAFQIELLQFLQPLWSGMDYTGFYILDKNRNILASNLEVDAIDTSFIKIRESFFNKLNSGVPAISLPVFPAKFQGGDPEATHLSALSDTQNIFSGAPILNESGNIVAYIIFRLSQSNSVTKVLQHGHIGTSGETYAFNRQGRLISNGRNVQKSEESATRNLTANLENEISESGKSPENNIGKQVVWPLTELAQSEILGNSGMSLEGYLDYRGVAVVGAWHWDDDLEFGIATKIEKSKAYQSIISAQHVILILTVLAIAMIIGLIILRFIYGERKIALQQKSESEARLRLLLESVGEGVFGVDLQGNCTFINSNALSLLGYDNASQLIGKSIHPIIHHTKANGAPCLDADCRIYGAFRKAKNFYVDDEVLWRADDSCFNVEYRSSPIYRNNKITGSVASFTDITARKQAESALRNSESKYRQVFNSILDVYAEISTDGTILEVSPSVKSQTGYTREELLGRQMQDFYAYQSDRETLLKRIYQDGMINDYEARLIDKDGQVRPFSFTGKVVVDDKNQPVKLVGVMRNIADRKQAEESMRDARDELERRVQERTVELEIANQELRHEIKERKLVEHELRDQRDKTQRYLDTVEAIIVSLNHVGEITLINRKGCELLGYSEKELLGKHWFKLCLPQPEGMERIYPLFEEIICGNLEAAEYVENSVLTRDGSRRLIAWHNSYFRAESGEIIGTISAGEDISDRVQAEEKARLHEAELAHMARLNIMGEMATGMAHELNQPLSAITTYADVALRILAPSDGKFTTDKTERLQQAVKGAREQAHRAAEIIRHLRQLVSKQTAQKVDVNLNQLIKDSFKLMEHEIKEHQVELTQILENKLPLIAADPIQIEQVIINLVRNSLEAIRHAQVKPGKITIQSEINNENEIQVTISDNGPGVAEENIHRIFDPFVTAKGGASMGMGLSISRSIVEAHHGKLSVKSEPGKGASFFFILPIDNQL